MMSYTPEKQYKYTMRKLPMWGKKFEENQINFEWPTQEIFDQMQHDQVKLASIEFNSCNDALASCQFILSNDLKSPMT